MPKAEIVSWIGVVLAALGDNPVAALAMIVAVLALLVALAVVSRNSKE